MTKHNVSKTERVMVDISNISDKDDVIAVKVRGNLSKEDYDEINPRIDQKIQQHDKIKMLFELEDVDAAGIGAMWEELKFDAQHSDDVSKIAIVGEETSEKVLANMKKPMTSAETKFFKPHDRDAALNWLRSENLT